MRTLGFLGFGPFFTNFYDLYSKNISAPQREVTPHTPLIFRVPVATVYAFFFDDDVKKSPLLGAPSEKHRRIPEGPNNSCA